MEDDQGKEEVEISCCQSVITVFNGFLFLRILEICRVCRCESTPDHPLFHPCKCSGSIRFVHQDWYVSFEANQSRYS